MKTKPKLIVLNGPLGVGKSTLAELYCEHHALALNLDIDSIRAMLGKWRDKPEESHDRAVHMATELARINLMNGSDVIVPQMVRSLEMWAMFDQLAAETNAKLYEILLFVEKDEAIKRFILRGQKSGNPNGFKPGGLIDTGGREHKLAKMYDEMLGVVKSRSRTIKITPEYDAIKQTYLKLIETLEHGSA